jgi:hypothetical protein
MALTNPMFERGELMMRRFQFLLLIATLPIALSTFGDTVTLRDGTRYDGTFVTGSSRSGITFRDRKGTSHHFATKRVQSLEFGSPADATLRKRPTQSLQGSTPLGAAKIIPSGTELAVRSNETIDSKTAAVAQHFLAVIDRDILSSSGALAIPKGSNAELVIRKTVGGSTTSASELVLDIDSVTVAGRRYLVSTGDLEEKGRQGLGPNKRTAEMVGGGAAIGALIGAVVGHGKGAAIGAAVGAGAGAGGQVLTKGKEVRVPAETIMNFKLDKELRLEPAR